MSSENQGPKLLEKAVDAQFFARNMGEYGIENIYRRFPRAPYESVLILNDQKRGYYCNSIDISEKGISVKSDQLLPFHRGDEVTVTVRNFPEIGTFSAHAVVLRQFKIDEADIFGFYFLRLNPNIRRHIAHYILAELKRLNPDLVAG